ncbi:MAG: signal peptidase I [Ruminococcus sp.]|nr:signal peptidase I [Ruminococcus sp.]
MKKVIGTLKKIADIFCWIVLGTLVVVVLVAFVFHMKDDIPNLFGYSICRVSSPSMEPELMVGDVILGKEVDDASEIEVGDVITFRGSGEYAGMFITHKVIVAPEMENGKMMLQTQGVANDTPDAPIDAESVKSVVICKIPVMRAFYNYFFSPWGLITIIALIIFAFFDELILVVKTLAGEDKKMRNTDINDIIGRIKASEEDSLPEEAGSDEILSETEASEDVEKTIENKGE